MKRNLYIAVALTMLLLYGCISKERMNAAALAAESIGAQGYTVGLGTSAGTDGNYKSINLEFSNFGALPPQYDANALSLTSASVFLKNLKPEDYSGIDKVKVTLTIQNSIIESLYDVSELSLLNTPEKVR